MGHVKAEVEPEEPAVWEGEVREPIRRQLTATGAGKIEILPALELMTGPEGHEWHLSVSCRFPADDGVLEDGFITASTVVEAVKAILSGEEPAWSVPPLKED